MAFKLEEVDLANKIYGWGTSPKFNGFSTNVVDSHFTTSGVAMRAVPRNSNFMPFSNLTVPSGYARNGAKILLSNGWAQVNRFILSNTPKVTRTTHSSFLIPIYYSGTNPHGTGSLYIGGTSSTNRVSSSCPPVVMLVAQAAGGKGGNGVAFVHNYIGFFDCARSCGGGGSGGAATLAYWRFPTNGLSLVGFLKIYGDVSLYDKNQNQLFICRKGNDGQNGSITYDNGSGLIQTVLHPDGGVSVSGDYTGMSSNLDFSTAYITSQDGTTSFLAAFGLAGGKGSLYTNDPDLINNNKPATNGGSFTSTIYLNGLSNCTLPSRAGGSAYFDGGYYEEGGGGGASRFGSGGATRSGTGSGYGQGGGGGRAEYASTGWFSWVLTSSSGGAGGAACIQFYW